MIKEKLNIITPVLKYWGLREHPFEDYVLKGETLRLFTGRDYELNKLVNALTNRLNGLYGARGVGKSSFLHKFEKTVIQDGLPVVYVSMSGITEKALYREILAELLKAIQKEQIKINRKYKVNAKDELERLENSIKETNESEVGGQLVFKGGKKEAKEKSLRIHDEESAVKLIHNIINNSQTAFVVIVDDLERVEHIIDNDNAYVRFISGVARTIDESFSRQGIAFVVSLDEKFAEKVKQDLHNGEGAFSFGTLVGLPSFNPQETIKLIGVRLRDKKWSKNIAEFIDEDAFWLLMLSTSGHPRKMFALLRNSMEYVEFKKKKLKLDLEIIKHNLDEPTKDYDDKDLEILKYLSDKGAASASDIAFQRKVGLSRKPLAERLKTLKDKLQLNCNKQAIGNTVKDIYSLPTVEFND